MLAEDVCLNPLCYYPDLLSKAVLLFNQIAHEKTVLGKLNVWFTRFANAKILWKTLKTISADVKERLLMRRCTLCNTALKLAIVYEVSGDDQLPLLILIVYLNETPNERSPNPQLIISQLIFGLLISMISFTQGIMNWSRTLEGLLD